MTHEPDAFCAQLLKYPLDLDAESPTLPPALKARYVRLGDSGWFRENRWLYQAPTETRVAVLLRFAHFRLSIRQMDLELFLRTLFHHISTQPELPKSGYAKLLQLTPNTFGMLLNKACAADIPTAVVQRVMRAVLVHMWQQLLKDTLVVTRSHALLFYERLHTLFIYWTTPEGSATFTGIVETLAEVMRPFRGTASVGEYRSYRVACLRRIHRVLIGAVFVHVSSRGHYADLDVLFAHNRGQLVSVLRHWLASLHATDVDRVWTTCAAVRAYCLHNVFRLQPVLQSTPALWSRCAANVHADALRLSDCASEDVVPTLHANLARTGGPLAKLLQQFPPHTQRRVVRAVVRWVCLHPYPGEDWGVVVAVADAEEESPAPAPAPPVPPTETATLRQQLRAFLKTHVRSLLRITQTAEYLVRFYLMLTHDHHTVFTCVCSPTKLVPKTLQRWVDIAGAIPVEALESVASRAVAQMRSIHALATSATTTAATDAALASDEVVFVRMLQTLRWFDRDISRVLQHPLDVARGLTPAVLQSLFRHLDYLVTDSEEWLSQLPTAQHQGISRLVRCVLIAFIMEHSTEKVPDDGEALCCAICYEHTDAAFHRLPCGHTFHAACMFQTVQLAQWASFPTAHLEGSGGPARCPYCMQPVPFPRAALEASGSVSPGLPKQLSTLEPEFRSHVLRVDRWWRTNENRAA